MRWVANTVSDTPALVLTGYYDLEILIDGVCPSECCLCQDLKQDLYLQLVGGFLHLTLIRCLAESCCSNIVTSALSERYARNLSECQ